MSMTLRFALLAGLSLPALAIPFGWRWAYVASAVLALAALAVAPAVTETRPAEQRCEPVERSRLRLKQGALLAKRQRDTGRPN